MTFGLSAPHEEHTGLPANTKISIRHVTGGRLESRKQPSRAQAVTRVTAAPVAESASPAGARVLRQVHTLNPQSSVVRTIIIPILQEEKLRF